MPKKLSFFLFLIFAAVFVILYMIPAFKGEIVIDPGFNIAGLSLQWYGLIAAIAVLTSFYLAWRLAAAMGLDPLVVERILPWAVAGGFLGARIYFVVFSWSYFQNHFSEIPAVWRGGLSIYGGLGGGILGSLLCLKLGRVKSVWNVLGLGFAVLPLGQAIGRFGNFFNQEAFGLPTDLPWGMYVAPAHREALYAKQQFFHPAFLYEALWNLAVFGILLYLVRKHARGRWLVGSYLVLYPLGRFFIESLRLDSFFISSVRVDQVTSLVAMAVGALIIYSAYKYEQALENR